MNDKVLLAVLRERTSASGTRYLSGWLGKARIVGFLDRDAPEDETHWQLYAQTPEDRGERTGNGGRQQQQASADDRRGGWSRDDRQERRPAAPRARQAVPPGELDDSMPF